MIALVAGVLVFSIGYGYQISVPKKLIFEQKFGLVLNVPGDIHRHVDILVRKSPTNSKFSFEASLNGSPQYFSINPKILTFTMRDKSDVKLEQTYLKFREDLISELEVSLPKFLFRHYSSIAQVFPTDKQNFLRVMGFRVIDGKYVSENSEETIKFITKKVSVIKNKSYVRELGVLSFVFALIASAGFGLMKRKRHS